VRFISASLALAVLGLASNAGAQDPLKILPDSYRLELENEWVRVVHVRYAPHAKLPAHDHPTVPTAFVYLNDAGPVLFKHIGLSYGVIGRPATVAGAIRLARAVQEVHEVENPGDTPSEFLRVEFKRMPLDTPLRGRYYPETHPPGENFAKLHFENEHLRLTRRACAPDVPCDLAAAADTPALVVGLGLGSAQWLAAGGKRVVQVKEPAEFLLFEFKGGAR
jgi:hypothetical protein